MLLTSDRFPTSLIAIAGCAVLFFSDCDPFDDYRARRDSITLQHGNSVAHNIAVQTIDPWPYYAARSRIDIDGDRLLIAIDRYKANKSIPPKGLTTQSVIVAPPNGGGLNGY